MILQLLHREYTNTHIVMDSHITQSHLDYGKTYIKSQTMQGLFHDTKPLDLCHVSNVARYNLSSIIMYEITKISLTFKQSCLSISYQCYPNQEPWSQYPLFCSSIWFLKWTFHHSLVTLTLSIRVVAVTHLEKQGLLLWISQKLLIKFGIMYLFISLSFH